MYTRYDKMREVEQKITDLKNEKFEALTRPVAAFITFEEEDAYNLSQHYEPKFSVFGKKLEARGDFLGKDLFLTPATEPTNIIWENRHLSHKERFKRLIIVICITAGLALACFVGIFFIKSVPIWINETWQSADCPQVKETYGDRMEEFALQEWKARFLLDNDDYQMSGVL